MSLGAENAIALLERFEIRRSLGQGGHGVVSEAYDSLRKETVALKSLQRVGGEALYRFKREFRSLAGLSHPNLVSLYELFASGDQWYFTMELVRGISFIDWVRGPVDDRDVPETIDVPRGPVTGLRAKDPSRPPPREHDLPQGGREAMYGRLRHAARQLAQGLCALHEAGWKHGDVKPSNVLVTSDGRVVVLDFGVITELDDEVVDEVAGTPVYMAPEQVRCETVTAASDWYSFGVMLFEGMTGRRPMEGGAITVMSLKARAPRVPEVDELPTDAPPDLRALCVDLLRAAPEDRPSGAEVLRRLGAAPSLVPAPASPASGGGGELVGRAAEVARLRELLADVEHGRGRAALVHAPSGMGKTELVDAFLESLADREDLVILRGRCYEREAVPYKALDNFVDGLVRWLRSRPSADVDAVLPEDTVALAAAFPVVKRLDPVVMRSSATELYFEHLGRRALAALGEMVGKLARRHRMVVFIDDLQWGDLDSAAFLAGLVTPDGPPLLFLGSFRSDHRTDSALVRALFEAARLTPGSLVELPLAPVSTGDLETLARRLLRRAGAPEELAPRIALQAKGSPYFAQELARHVGTGFRRGAAAEGATTLKDVVLARARRLSPEARELLDVVAVAGAPMPRNVLDQATAWVAESKYFVELAAGHFTTTRMAGDEERVDTAHDAVREALLEALSEPQARALHMAVAHALEAPTAHASAHDLAEHYFQAWPDAPSGRVFELCYAAGKEAAASHAYEQAYVHMARARQVAGHAAVDLDVTFLKLYGEVASHAGHMDSAAEMLRSALPKATDRLQVAELHLALARVAMGRIDTAIADEESKAGLEALGYPKPHAGAAGVLLGGASIVRTQALLKLRPATYGELRGDARARVGTALMKQSAKAAYFRMDRLTTLEMNMYQYALATKLGISPELADCYATAALVLATIGRAALARSFIDRALTVSDTLGSPLAAVPVMEYRAHALHFMGECVAGEAAMAECLTERGQWMENADYLTALAHLAWNALMRGKAELGWRWVLRGMERTAVDGDDSRLTKGHTFLCYGGPLLARLGRPDDGRRMLQDFRARLDEDGTGGAREIWRPASWLAHWSLFLVLTGEVGDAFDRAVREFQELVKTPTSVALVIRHFYVAHARGRLLQLERMASADEQQARARFDVARRQLASVANHPTLEAHLAVVEARAYLFDGARESARERLDHAQMLAVAHENAWIADEVASLRARLAAS